MNAGLVLALMKNAWLSRLQSRNFFFLLAFSWMVPPLISLFVWYTAAGGSDLKGLSQSDFVLYYLAFIVVNQLTYAETNWTVGDGIRNGDMSRSLLYPISPLYRILTYEVAGKAVYLLFIIPVVTILGLLLHPTLHLSGSGVLLFLISVWLSWILRFFWGYWIALLAFWSARADALVGVQNTLIFLLAGQVAPLALLPVPLQMAANVLPFRYMISFPIELLTGHLTIVEVISGFITQLCWILVALCLSLLVWRSGIRRCTAIGG